MPALDFLDIDIEERKTEFNALLGFFAIVMFIGIVILDDPLWSRLSTCATLLITFALIYLNAINNEVIAQQAKDSKKLMKAKTRPFVYITLKPADYSPWVIQMNIENIGLGIAKNIRFTISDNFITDSGPIQNYPLFQNGLPYLAPKENREFVLIDFSRRPYSEFENVILSITVKFHSLDDNEKFEYTFPLSFSEFNMMRYAPYPGFNDSKIGGGQILTQSATNDIIFSNEENFKIR